MRRQSIFGQGLAFPPRIDAEGRLAWSAGEENVRESIRLILLTEPGERLLREEFGCGLRQFLLEPNTETTRQLIHQRILRAIGRWEPRVAVEAITVEADAENSRLVSVAILFRLIATQAVGRVSMTLQLEA